MASSVTYQQLGDIPKPLLYIHFSQNKKKKRNFRGKNRLSNETYLLLFEIT
jgi:hypothetical protein